MKCDSCFHRRTRYSNQGKIKWGEILIGVSGRTRTYNLMGRNHLRYPLRHRYKIWPRRDLNPQPIGYEPTALTIELQGHLNYLHTKWKEVWESNPCSANIYGTQDINLSVLPITLTSPIKIGGQGGTRTLTLLRARDFKSLVAAITPLDHLALKVGLEPTTNRLTADRSTTELLEKIGSG